MTKLLISLFLLVFVEFLVIPASASITFPLIDGQPYWAGLAVLALPRVLCVAAVALLLGRGLVSRQRIVLLCGYALILVVRHLMSEQYIASGNVFAWLVAFAPYMLALITMTFALWGVNRRSDVEGR
jgi:hypothetical protein